MDEQSKDREPEKSRQRRVIVLIGATGVGLAAGAMMLTMNRSPMAPASMSVAEDSAPSEGHVAKGVQPTSPPPALSASVAPDPRQRAGAVAGKLQEKNLADSSVQQRVSAAGKKAEKPMACAPGDPLCALDEGGGPRAAPTVATMATATSDRLEARDVAIDPNGRFATTYRPGGGHLSAFEAALGQGLVPASDRELVSDVGARYTPTMAPPVKGKALAAKLDWERSKVQPGGGATHLRLALRSSEENAPRPHLSVHLVLDVSGSMAGKSMEDARKAAAALVDRLAPTDDFSLVTFSTDARVAVEDGPVGSRREHIKKVIGELHEEGGTNIGEGLAKGYAQAHAASIPADAVRVVMLLSDGRANEGLVQSESLAKLALDAFQEGVQTSTFGLGTDYDTALMSSIASDGAGGYYYLRDSEQIAPALTTEVERRLDPVATAVEVRVRLKPDVELLQVYGSRRLTNLEAANVRRQEVAADNQAQQRDRIKSNRPVDQEGGMRFFIPAFARGDGHALLFKLRLPAGVGSKPVALVEIKYKDRLGRRNVSEEMPLAVEFAGSDADSAATTDGSVVRTVQGFEAGEALAAASVRVNHGDREGATRLLDEREGILRQAAAQLGEPLFLRDADRLARLRSMASGGSGDPLVVAMLLETSSRVHLR